MNLTNRILRTALRCTGLTVLWIAISASAQVTPRDDHNAASAGRTTLGCGVLRRMPVQDFQADAVRARLANYQQCDRPRSLGEKTPREFASQINTLLTQN